MKTTIVILLAALAAFTADAQTITTKRIDQYSPRNPTDPNDLFLLEDNAFANYWTQTRSVLNSQFVAQTPNQWSGPTNSIDLNVAGHNNGDLYFVSPTSVSVTGFSNKGSSVQTVTLTVYNNSATNWTFYVPSACFTRDTARSYTVTNGQDFIISFRYHPGLQHTNAVTCPNG